MRTRTLPVTLAGLVVLLLFGCERSVDGLETPEFSNNPNVFLDGFSSGLNYAAFGGSVPTAFQVDEEVTYNATLASMRFEVPDANNPAGAYAGGVFFTSSPRNLSEYDALTFWIKSSQAASIDLLGFGNDLGLSPYQASISALQVNTNWKKVIIPLPDASKLTEERGMFFYSTGPINNNGYTFWIDEVKFEKLGTIAHPQFAILNGDSLSESSFSTVTRRITGLQSIFNLPNGTNIAVDASSTYFDFTSSDETVATVDATGLVTTGAQGTATIKASMNGIEADGALTIVSRGVYNGAPTPTHLPENVISIFSDAYENVPVNYYNGYWQPYQTTTSADFEVNGDHVLNYNNFNFVGIEFSSPTIDIRNMTHFVINLYIPNAFTGSPNFQIELVDFGADGVFGGTDNRSHRLTFTPPSITAQNWITLNIPLTSFTGLTTRAHLGQIIFEGTNIPGFYADNIYFRR